MWRMCVRTVLTDTVPPLAISAAVRCVGRWHRTPISEWLLGRRRVPDRAFDVAKLLVVLLGKLEDVGGEAVWVPRLPATARERLARCVVEERTGQVAELDETHGGPSGVPVNELLGGGRLHQVSAHARIIQVM